MNALFAPRIVGPSLWMDGTLDHKTSLKNVEGIRRFHAEAKPGSGVATVKGPDGKVLQKLTGDITINGQPGSGYQVTVQPAGGREAKVINLHSASDGRVSIGHIGRGPHPENFDRGLPKRNHYSDVDLLDHRNVGVIRLNSSDDSETAQKLMALDGKLVKVTNLGAYGNTYNGTGRLMIERDSSDPSCGYVYFHVEGVLSEQLFSDQISGTIEIASS